MYPPLTHTHMCKFCVTLYEAFKRTGNQKKRKQNTTPFDVEATKKSIVPHVRSRSGSDVAGSRRKKKDIRKGSSGEVLAKRIQKESCAASNGHKHSRTMQAKGSLPLSIFFLC